MKTPPAQVIHDCLSFQSRTGPIRAIIAAWPGFLFPATLMGFFSLRSFDLPCGWLRLVAFSRPHAVLPFARREIFFAGFVQIERTGGAVGRGFWGLAPRSSRAVLSIGPAIAFAYWAVW